MIAYVFILVALLANGLAGMAGALLSDRWLKKRQPMLIAFAAGALLAAAFLDLLPEAIETLDANALRWAFVGFLGVALVEWALGRHHAHEEQTRTPLTLPATLLVADGLHNIGDGAVIAAAFLVSPQVGLVASLAVIAHELPQEVGDYALLRTAGMSRAKSLIALALVQLSAALGAAAILVASTSWGQVSGLVLSIAAGSFLYIGATDLLPGIHAGRTPTDRRQRLFGLLAGVLLIALVLAFDHEHG